ncbi:hypothetical protein SAMN04487891_101485 [Flagellimonas taeanensis]|uniref:Uncharacterized protein n=1 Tax=Flagellimonas taeanensis TaxID=1005926 RepID=A0A1M6Q8K0_9FLAO|nr:hypothetical protein SAMN04487891_101485 [Allomuricauda taeanensis]SHK16599.1 hypothetical protein SAMN05216293_0492 [Allomuricauda taeanensis]
MDSYYQKHLKKYAFERISDRKQQLQGIDLVLKDKLANVLYYVDEKAQLDYVNESLPTFAFELFYEKEGAKKQGWLFDVSKKTHFYALVTSIFSDVDKVYTSCNITFVNREKLILHLSTLGLSREFFEQLVQNNSNLHGKFILEKLCPKKEGLLYFSTQNKAEKPINLILRLAYLEQIGVAKRLV